LGHDKGRLKPIAKGTGSNAVIARFLLGEISKESLLKEAESVKDGASRVEQQLLAWRTLGLLADLAGKDAEAKEYYRRCIEASRQPSESRDWALGRMRKLSQ
jgi:hypothetical protein